MAKFVGPRKTRRTNQRLARIRLRNPNALPNVRADSKYTPRQVRRVKRKDVRQRQRVAQRRAAKQYNPLSLISGDRERAEMAAAEKLEFGPAQHELREAAASHEQNAANRSTYYDDWRQALREATARVNETNRLNVEATEKRVDTAYQQDKSAVAARDAEASAQAAKLGRGPGTSTEGNQAVEAQRSQGNQAAARLREQAGADTTYLELRGTNAAQAKTEDQRRLEGKRDQLRREQRDLAAKKGAFRTDFRRKTRDSERQWAAIQKEFGLKERDMRLKNKATGKDRALERQKLRTQKIVANIYAAADKAGARSQVRVAKLQLDKGKITKDQYKHVVMEYRGLPGGGKGAKGAKGDKPKLQTWERDKIDTAVRQFDVANLSVRDRKRAIAAAVENGVNQRLARVAWNRYIKRLNKAVNQSPGGDRNQ